MKLVLDFFIFVISFVNFSRMNLRQRETGSGAVCPPNVCIDFCCGIMELPVETEIEGSHLDVCRANMEGKTAAAYHTTN